MNPFSLIVNAIGFVVTQVLNHLALFLAVAFLFFIITPNAAPEFFGAVLRVFVIDDDSPFALFGLGRWIYGIMLFVYIVLRVVEILTKLTLSKKS